jgi:hypothetical protein
MDIFPLDMILDDMKLGLLARDIGKKKEGRGMEEAGNRRQSEADRR